MKQLFGKIKSYIVDHKKQFLLGTKIFIGLVALTAVVLLIIYNAPRTPKIVYEPANACDLLTLDEAKTLLGDYTINGVSQTPVQSGSITVSKCSYSDGLTDVANAVVAAIIVRSGINDDGVNLNKVQFASGKPTSNVQDVKDLGDSAYFNQSNGQLNVLKDTTWVVISYGSGASPASNTLEDDVKLAQKVLN